MDCYFFGTFNPPHLGHIKLAKEVKKEFNFERIIFVPAFKPPHKETLDYFHRYNMLKLCVDEELGTVSDVESRLKTPSYTYQTVEYLIKQREPGIKEGKVLFITGYDAFINIEGWKNPDILKKNIHFIVLKRHSLSLSSEETRARLKVLKEKGFCFNTAENIDYFDVSSDEIRKLVSSGKATDGLLDIKVRKYIDEHGLYIKNSKEAGTGQ